VNRRLTVLLAEDCRGDVLLVQEALAKYQVPHELQVVRDGGEALDYVVRMGEPDEPPCPDLILLDLNLPKADGMTVLAEFRKHPQCARTPVIVITSSDTPKDRERVGALGVAAYFRKPSNLDEYLELGAVVLAVMAESA
jgi:CheY-like chemotaxis protein